MMSNLFTIFDTSTNMTYDYNWLSSIIMFYFMPMCYWSSTSKFQFLYKFIMELLYNEFKVILNNKFNLINNIFLISLMLSIFFNNIMGLFPYIFTSSSHLIFSLSITLPMWIAIMMFASLNNTNFMFSHMIPQSTPNILMPFMVLIESISNFIRPMTLAIRLTANMIAGHLLLTLLSQSMSNMFIIFIMMILLIQILLLILEFSVSIIQSYVFTILSTLYIKETN